MNDFTVSIRRATKLEVLKACQDLEKRGFEAVTPIREVVDCYADAWTGKKLKGGIKMYDRLNKMAMATAYMCVMKRPNKEAC